MIDRGLGLCAARHLHARILQNCGTGGRGARRVLGSCYILFPNYADASSRRRRRTRSMWLFIETVQPEVLSMDNYSAVSPGRHAERYRENLEIFREQSQAAGIPFGIFQHDALRPAHGSHEGSAGRLHVVAYGARCAVFLTTRLRAASSRGGGAIIQRTAPHAAYEAQRINAELKRLGPVLGAAAKHATVRVDESADVPPRNLAGSPLQISRDTEDPPLDLLAGLAHDDGRRAVLLNNYHFAYTVAHGCL